MTQELVAAFGAAANKVATGLREGLGGFVLHAAGVQATIDRFTAMRQLELVQLAQHALAMFGHAPHECDDIFPGEDLPSGRMTRGAGAAHMHVEEILRKFEALCLVINASPMLSEMFDLAHYSTGQFQGDMQRVLDTFRAEAFINVKGQQDSTTPTQSQWPQLGKSEIEFKAPSRIVSSSDDADSQAGTESKANDRPKAKTTGSPVARSTQSGTNVVQLAVWDEDFAEILDIAVGMELGQELGNIARAALETWYSAGGETAALELLRKQLTPSGREAGMSHSLFKLVQDMGPLKEVFRGTAEDMQNRLMLVVIRTLGNDALTELLPAPLDPASLGPTTP